MANASFEEWRDIVRSEKAQGRGFDTAPGQASLFNARVSTILPSFPNGQDIAFHCVGDDGRIYFCKDDKGGRNIRATEWIATKLAHHLGISVAECAILEQATGQTFFGSRSPHSLGSELRLNTILNRAATDELGREATWLGRYFAQLWAFDIFINNPDRTLQSFLLDQDGQTARLRAFDFASATFLQGRAEKFPIASDNTTRVGGIIRKRHGPHREAAVEMLNRIGAIPPGVIESILSEMPDGWLLKDQMGALIEVWSDGRSRQRASQVKALIEHDW